VNHPYKKGKYYVLVGSDGSGSGSKYCSKCAIKLAGTGVKVQEILGSDQALRKSEIEEFLIKLGGCKRGAAGFMSSLLNKKEDLNVYYEE
jgi:hypothetical protein